MKEKTVSGKRPTAPSRSRRGRQSVLGKQVLEKGRLKTPEKKGLEKRRSSERRGRELVGPQSQERGPTNV